MRSNIIAIFLLVVVTALTAIYWKVDQDFFSEKLIWNEVQSRSQLSALTRSVQSELEGFSQVLDLTLPGLRDSKKDYDHDQVYSNFQMIGTLSEQNSEIRIDQKYFLEGTTVKTWAPTYISLALQGMHLTSESQNFLLTILDPKRRAWILFVTTSRVTQKQYAAILSSDAMQGIIDRQKGQMATLSILNGKTQVLGHTTSEYIGSLLKEDPLAQELIKTGNGSGSGLFESQGERVHGFYEQVEGTNLFVTVETPLRLLMADREKIKTKFVFMGLGISLLGVAMLMLLGGSSALSQTAQAVASPKDSSKVVANPVAAIKLEAAAKLSKMPIAAVAATPPSVLLASVPSAPPALPAEEEKLPAPPVDKHKSDSDEKFAVLFNDRKIQETFEMIDQLDSPPQPPPLPPINVPVMAQPPPLPRIKTPVVAQPPPLPGSTPDVIIHLQRKTSKLDELDFEVRRPGQPVFRSEGDIS